MCLKHFRNNQNIFKNLLVYAFHKMFEMSAGASLKYLIRFYIQGHQINLVVRGFMEEEIFLIFGENINNFTK